MVSTKKDLSDWIFEPLRDYFNKIKHLILEDESPLKSEGVFGVLKNEGQYNSAAFRSCK